MMEAFTFIDGMKVIVPLDRCDAAKYGWHHGAEFKAWWYVGGDIQTDITREREIRDWCQFTFGQNAYKIFHDSVYFYREQDAVLCQLRWA